MKRITSLLVNIPDKVCRFITKKWIEAHDQSGNAKNKYKPSKQIRLKKSMLQSDLCDYSGAYNVVKGTITVEETNNDAYDRKLVFKNNAPFISCISKINNTLIDNAENLDIVVPMYNLLEYSRNYSKTSGTLWNYHRDEPSSGFGGDNSNIYYSIRDSKSFNYRTSNTGKLEDSNREKKMLKLQCY